MNCIIVDDDDIARRLVEECVERIGSLELLGTFDSIGKAINLIKQNSVDLIFLDIEMPEITGIDFIKTFHNIPQIIIISGRSDYAIEAFDYDVTDYLLKPVKYDRFLKAVLKAQLINENVKINYKEIDHLFIKKDGAYHNVGLSSIHYIEALADYVNIYTASQRFTILSTMKAIEAKLPAAQFSRIHNSFIVRIDKVKEIKEGTLNCMGKTIPLSRSRKNDFFSKLNVL